WASGSSSGTTIAETRGASSATKVIPEKREHGDRRARSAGVASRHREARARRDASRSYALPRLAELARPPGRPACRRPPRRGGWISGAAELLDRVSSGGFAARPDRGTPRGWRGVAVPLGRTARGRRAGAAR